MHSVGGRVLTYLRDKTTSDNTAFGNAAIQVIILVSLMIVRYNS